MRLRGSASIVLAALSVLSTLPASGATEEASPGVTSSITHVEPGGEPRQLLEYDWIDGQTDSAIVEISRDYTWAYDGEVATEFRVPSVRLALLVTVREVTDEGDYLIETTVRNALPADPDLDSAPALAADLQTLIGVTVEERLDGHGRLIFSNTIDPLEDTSALGPVRDATRDALEYLTVYLPDEPMGAGGSWREAVSGVEADGADGLLTTDYTIESLPGPGLLRLDASSSASRSTKAVDPPDWAPGGRMTRETSELASTSVFRIDVGRLAQAQENDWQWESRYTLDADGTSYGLIKTTSTKLVVVPSEWPDPAWPVLPSSSRAAPASFQGELVLQVPTRIEDTLLGIQSWSGPAAIAAAAGTSPDKTAELLDQLGSEPSDVQLVRGATADPSAAGQYTILAMTVDGITADALMDAMLRIEMGSRGLAAPEDGAWPMQQVNGRSVFTGDSIEDTTWTLVYPAADVLFIVTSDGGSTMDAVLAELP